MPHGGARPNSGPAPDPNALRRERNDDKATWITLPAVRTEPAPAWPLMPLPSEPELIHWNAVWALPQAHQWAANHQEVTVALYVRSLGEAQIPGAAANLRTLVKQFQEELGISLSGLQRNRWKIAGSTTPAATASTTTSAARPSRGRTSARDRLKVVPGAEE